MPDSSLSSGDSSAAFTSGQLSSSEENSFSSSSLSSGSSSDFGDSSSDNDDDDSSSDLLSSDEEDRSDEAGADVDERSEDMDFEAKHARALERWGVDSPAAEEEKLRSTKTKVKKQARSELLKEGAGIEAATRESVTKRDWAEDVVGLSEAEILDKLRELTSSRQKRSGERASQLRQAQLHAKENGLQLVYIEALRAIIGLWLDLSASVILSVSQWTDLAADIFALYGELCDNAELTFVSSEGSPAAALAGYVDCVQTNLTKGIKSSDGDYRERLELLPKMLALLIIRQAFLELTEATSLLKGRSLVHLISAIYYVTDRVAEVRWSEAFSQIPERCRARLEPHFPYKLDAMTTSSDWVKAAVLSVVRCELPDTESTFLALCYYVQNAALNGHVDEAREVMTSTPLYDLAQTLEATSQVHYNRAVCQIGLAAFRQGNFQLASTFLNDICQNNKQRELLAQGLSQLLTTPGGGNLARDSGGRLTESGRSEREKLERRRMLPMYLHLNLDLIESASNIYSVLNSRSSRFRRMLEYMERSFIPPETSREIVWASGRKLFNGDYQGACSLIRSLKFWQNFDEGCFPDGSGSAAAVQAKIFEKFKEIALVCYFQRYAPVYDSFSARNLAEMFELTREEVYTLVSRMILKKELAALWDANHEILYMTPNQPTPLQALTHATLKSIDALLEAAVAAN